MVPILIRCVAALALVLATFNPTGVSFFHWATQPGGSIPLVALAGIVLVIAYVIFLRATFRSIGPFGILLVAALIGAVIWVLVDFGIISLQNPGAMSWVGLIAVSLILGVGLSWSIVRRALTGQVDMDDVQE